MMLSKDELVPFPEKHLPVIAACFASSLDFLIHPCPEQSVVLHAEVQGRDPVTCVLPEESPSLLRLLTPPAGQRQGWPPTAPCSTSSVRRSGTPTVHLPEALYLLKGIFLEK